jgi:hypothetical protein
VQAVGDQGGRADTSSDPDAIEGHPFIADETEQSGQGDPADMLDGAGMDESPDGLYPAMIAESAIIATTNIPARSSTRPNP